MSSTSSPALISPLAQPQIELETLREGDQGSSVTQLQAQLTQLKFYQGDTTGKFDSATKQALEAFQTQYGVTDEAGFFGPQTWYALTFWSQETDWPIPAILPALKHSITAFVESAAHQPDPILSKQARPERDLMPGQVLFWPPFGKKHHSTAQSQ